MRKYMTIGFLALIITLSSIGVAAFFGDNGQQIAEQQVGNEVKLQSVEQGQIVNRPNQPYIKLAGETIIIKKIDEKTYLKSYPSIRSSDDLLAYKQRSIQRLALLEPSDEISAVVTFKQPLSEDELVITLRQDMKIQSVKYQSYPEGVGEHPYPLNAYERERLISLGEDIAVDMERLNNITDFRLIEGYVAARVTGNVKDFLKISENSNVFLVSVGPRELIEEYDNAEILSCGDDVYYEYKKYGG